MSKAMRQECPYLVRETAMRPYSRQEEEPKEMWLGIGGRLPLGGALEAIEEPREDLEQKNDTV